MNGAASLHSGNPACWRSVSEPLLRRSAGWVSTLARKRPVALSRGLPFASESSLRGFSARLSPKRSCLAAQLPAPVTPFDRTHGAPQTWVECGPTLAFASHWESAEAMCGSSARAILSVGFQPVTAEPSCIEVKEVSLVTQAVHAMWRAAYGACEFGRLNAMSNPP